MIILIRQVRIAPALYSFADCTFEKTNLQMSSPQLIQFFRNSNLVSQQAAEQIAAVFSYRELRKNEFFIKEGRVCDEYLFLEKGFIRAFAHDTGGNDVTTHFYSAGQVVFEVFSFFNRTISKENFQALTDCEGWVITYEQLNYLFHSMLEFREFGRSILVKGFSSLKARMLSMITETAEQRYHGLLNNNPEIFEQAALKHIASYLGITDSSLSRIRKEYARK
jgi:CRP-like cAMP-binding protein